MSSRIQTYILSYLSYASIHSIRSSYSFSKQNLLLSLNTHKSYLGSLDFIMLMSLGLGFLLHTLYPHTKPIRALWIALMLCSFSYLMIPLTIMTINSYIKLIVFLLMMFNGFMQSYIWPSVMLLLYSKFNATQNPLAVGFWSTCANFGNILGFAGCNLIVIIFQFPWYYGIYACCTFIVLISLIISLRTPQILYKQNQFESIKQYPNKQLEYSNQKPSFWILISNPIVGLVCIIFGIAKSAIYGILLWLPLYLGQINMKKYSALLPLCFDICCILGSIFLASIFHQFRCKGIILAFVALILILCFILMKILLISVIGYFIIVGILGFFIGGQFNLLAGLVTISLAQAEPQHLQKKYLNFYSALTMTIGNISAALTQIIIGIFSQNNKEAVFDVLLICQVLALICSLGLVFMEWKRQSVREQYNIKQ